MITNLVYDINMRQATGRIHHHFTHNALESGGFEEDCQDNQWQPPPEAGKALPGQYAETGFHLPSSSSVCDAGASLQESLSLTV